MIILLDDSYLPFVKQKMQELDPDTFTDFDFNIFETHEHLIIGYKHKDNIITFCCLIGLGGVQYVVYTWCTGTIRSKKAFLEGIDYLIKEFPKVQFVEEVKLHPLYKAYTKHKEKQGGQH